MNKVGLIVESKILVLYTGGTIGMLTDQNSGALVPGSIDAIKEELTNGLQNTKQIDFISLAKPLDSSNIQPSDWLKIAEVLSNQHKKYDGFVVLHGTDTMAYTASVVSFLLPNFSKPIVFTGSQLPISFLNSDALRNFQLAVKVISTTNIAEVVISFWNKVYRANRCTKSDAENFAAFSSPNFPVLYDDEHNVLHTKDLLSSLEIFQPSAQLQLNSNVGVIKIYPGISAQIVENLPFQGLILETFGAGNIPTNSSFIEGLKKLVNKGCFILNKSQCSVGKVDMSKYETGKALLDLGVINGFDLTTEAAFTKMMVVLGNESNEKIVRDKLERSLCGELTR